MGRLKRQELDLNEFIEWLNKSSIMYAKCSISDKELKVTTRGIFEIWHKGNLAYECQQPFKAIEVYNEL